MKKFELTSETVKLMGITMYRIKALIDFADVKAGDLGGYVEKESNLSQIGNAWVNDEAMVYNEALVSDNAVVSGRALVADNAQVSGNAVVSDTVVVQNDAVVCESAVVCNDAVVYGNAVIRGNAVLGGEVSIGRRVQVAGNTHLSDNDKVGGDANSIYIQLSSKNLEGHFFKTKRGMEVVCGDIDGKLSDFIKMINSDENEKDYLKMVEIAKNHFELQEANNGDE